MQKKGFGDFSPITTKEWKDKIIADLKGADFEKKLVWQTNEGFSLQPFYRAEDLKKISHCECLPNESPFARGTKTGGNNWWVRQDLKVENSETANKKAIEVLEKGANSIAFIFDSNTQVAKKELNKLLKGIIEKNSIEINIRARNNSQETLASLIQLSKEKKKNLALLTGSIDFDPLGCLLIYGTICVVEYAIPQLIKNMVEAGEELPNFRLINVNASHFNNAGASIVQELGFGLAMANEYLAQLTEQGMSLEQITPKIQFTFAAGSNYFMEIAKIRAARLLWAKIVEVYQPKSLALCDTYIHTETSMWNKTIFDPHVNMLRTQIESMAAAIGGSDSITINPFDANYKTPNEFSERIARNQQILLQKEAYIEKVADPAGGSYYIETLTDSIAQEAWKLFKEVEEQGGYIEALKKQFIQKQVEKIAEKRNKDIATRRETLLGTNQYPNFSEQRQQEIEPARLKSKKIQGPTFVRPLQQYRGAEEFEKLRLATERSNKRPEVFIFTIGNLTIRRERAQFASNFFACAGYKIVDNNGFASIKEGIAQLEKIQPDIVVLCSSDDECLTIAPPLYSYLKNKSLMVIAGALQHRDQLKEKGIEHFIHTKTNLLETLQYFNKQLGISKEDL